MPETGSWVFRGSARAVQTVAVSDRQELVQSHSSISWATKAGGEGGLKRQQENSACSGCVRMCVARLCVWGGEACVQVYGVFGVYVGGCVCMHICVHTCGTLRCGEASLVTAMRLVWLGGRLQRRLSTGPVIHSLIYRNPRKVASLHKAVPLPTKHVPFTAALAGACRSALCAVGKVSDRKTPSTPPKAAFDKRSWQEDAVGEEKGGATYLLIPGVTAERKTQHLQPGKG